MPLAKSITPIKLLLIKHIKYSKLQHYITSEIIQKINSTDKYNL